MAAKESTQTTRRGAPERDAPRQRILRIGLFINEKAVDERLVRDRGPVTIGQSGRNTFAVPAPELPRSWTLFNMVNGRYVLQVTETMAPRVRVADGGQPMTVDRLVQANKAKKVGNAIHIPLSEHARGRLEIGDLLVLFQFVMAPPLQPRPQLPHSVRGSLADHIDPYMAIVLVLSFIAHFATYGYFRYIMDPPRKLEPDEIPDRFAKVLMTRPKPPEVKKPTEGPGAETPAEEAKGEEEPKKKDDKPEEPQGAPDKAAVEQKIQQTAVLKVLGAKSRDGSGAFVNVSGGKDDAAALDRGLGNLGNQQIAATGPGALGGGTRGNTGGEIGTGTQTGVSGPRGDLKTGADKVEQEVRVTGNVNRAEGDEVEGLDPDSVTRTIKERYFSRVQQCYQRALKANPSLGGKVDLTFTIGIAGNVTSVNADGFDEGVDQCIEAEARRWRFSKPAESANFEISFVLRKAG